MVYLLVLMEKAIEFFFKLTNNPSSNNLFR